MKKFYLIVLFLLLASIAFPQTSHRGKRTTGAPPPATFVSDSFTEGSNVNLSSHTGETGATWTLHTSYSGTITVDATLDRIYLTSASAAAYYASGTSANANYCVSGDFRRLSSLSNNVSIGMWSTSADTAPALRLNDNGATVVWETYDRTAGSNVVLASISTNIPSVGGAAVNAELCRNGTSLTVFFDTVQNTGLNSTTGITAIGRPAIRVSGTASSTTGIHVDNFIARQ